MYANYNPYNIYNNQMPANNTGSNLIRVTGIDGARAYQMMPNTVTALFDSSQDLMYIKSTDGAGFPTIRTFSFTEVLNTDKKPTSSEYATKEELETLKKEVAEYVQLIISDAKQQPSNKPGNKSS